MQKSKIKYLALLILLLLAGIWFLARTKNSSGRAGGLNPVGDNPTVTPTISASLGKTYASPNGEFSFNYPEGFVITELPINEATTSRQIIVESGEPQRGFELDILAFDEPGPLTSERIKQDLPDIEISQSRDISISSITALAFESTDPPPAGGIGKTYEIWFVHDGNLYQAKTYRTFGKEMEEMMRTIKFKN